METTEPMIPTSAANVNEQMTATATPTATATANATATKRTSDGKTVTGKMPGTGAVRTIPINAFTGNTGWYPTEEMYQTGSAITTAGLLLTDGNNTTGKIDANAPMQTYRVINSTGTNNETGAVHATGSIGASTPTSSGGQHIMVEEEMIAAAADQAVDDEEDVEEDADDVAERIANEKWISRIRGTALVEPKNPFYDSRMDEFLFGMPTKESMISSKMVAHNLTNKKATLDSMRYRYDSIQQMHKKNARYVEDPIIQQEMLANRETFKDVTDQISTDDIEIAHELSETVHQEDSSNYL